jgi:hypothetical protein
MLSFDRETRILCREHVSANLKYTQIRNQTARRSHFKNPASPPSRPRPLHELHALLYPTIGPKCAVELIRCHVGGFDKGHSATGVAPILEWQFSC